MQVKNILCKISFAIILALPLHIYGQQANTLYFMKGVPQIYQVNPAFQPDCNFFLGFPGFAPFHLRVENTPFALSDVIMYNEQIDSLITFLHPLADKEQFLGLLRNRNYVNTELGTSLGSFGFRANNAYFTFDISTRGNARFSYPGDLLRLPIYGPDEDRIYDFNGLGVNVGMWNEYAMGVSYRFAENLSLGLRGKILMGIADFRLNTFDVTLSTGEESWDIHSNILANAALPFLEMSLDEDGMIDFENVEPKEFPQSLKSVLANFKNSGLALDIGVDYRPLDWLQVSASLVDFGSIRWRDGVYNIGNNGNYSFSGIEIKLEEEDAFEGLLDSLEQTFEFTATESEYRAWLPAKFYAGAAFYPHPKISFGVLSRTEFMEGDIRQQFTLSANFYPLRMLSAGFSYSVMEGSFKNLGFGLSLKPGPFNLYIITDTGPSAAFWPYDTRYVNLRAGLNLAFGCKKIKKEPKFDRPLP